MPQHPHIYDIILVGAGATSISGGNKLLELGIQNFRLLEASGRVGGRAYTIPVYGTNGNCVLIDIGGGWIHAPNEDNPMAKDPGIADYGPSYDHESNCRIIINGADCTNRKTEMSNFLLEHSYVFGLQEDITCSEIVKDASPFFYSMSDFHYGSVSTGRDLDVSSAIDDFNNISGVGGILLEKGIGTYIRDKADRLIQKNKIRFNTEIKTIDTSKPGLVKITDTEDKHYYARKVVITVSAGVINSGAIEFIPALPPSHLAAFDQIKMGTMEKFVFLFENKILQNIPANTRLYILDENKPPLMVHLRTSGKPVAIAITGGSFSEFLLNLGPDNARDYILARMQPAFKTDLRSSLQGYKQSNWRNNNRTRGSYSSADIHGTWARRVITVPVGNLSFAGEACDHGNNFYTHLYGAIYSGENAVINAVASLSGQPHLANAR